MDIIEKLHQLNPHHPDLNRRLSHYLEAFTQEDYDGILMLTYPGIFEHVPRQLLREKIIETFHGEETEFSMDIFEVDTIGKMINHDQGRYIKIRYTMLMAMRFVAQESDPEKADEHTAFMLRMMRAFYGEDNIWFEDTTRSYCFYQKKTMVAIEDQLSPQWTFLNYQPGPFMENFLPETVRLLLDADLTSPDDYQA